MHKILMYFTILNLLSPYSAFSSHINEEINLYSVSRRVALNRSVQNITLENPGDLLTYPLKNPRPTLEELEPVYEFLRDRYQPVDMSYLFDGTPDAIYALSCLPDELLPRLPDQYIWHRTPYGLQLKKYVFSMSQTEQTPNITIVIYGPNQQGNINYLTMIDNVNYQGFIHPRSKGEGFLDKQISNGTSRRYPIHEEDFDIMTAVGWQRRHDRGHIVPFYDTMEIGRDRLSGERIKSMIIPQELRHNALGRYYSTHDRRNYIPEPFQWNQVFRRTLEGRQRRKNECFLQYPYYDENYYQYDEDKYVYKPPLYTKNRTRIPEGVIFAEVGKPTPLHPFYSVGNIYDAHWNSVLSSGLSVDEFCDNFSDPDRFLPYPPISQFDKGIGAAYDYVENLKPKIQSNFDHRIGSYTALNKVLHLQSVAASHQFTRPAYSLEQAFNFSGEMGSDLYKTRYWVARSWDLGSFIDKELDNGVEVLSQREMEDLEFSYRNQELGFEDPFYHELDFWRQIYSNQNER